MSDDVWRAPGREGTDGSRPGAGEPYVPAPEPGQAPTPGPYATPAAPSPGGWPSTGSVHPGAAPYGAPPASGSSSASPSGPATSSSPGPHATSSPVDPYATPSSPGAFATSDRHRDRVLGGAGYDSPAYRNDSAAVTSMIFGVLGIVVPGVCLLAVAFGHLARHRLRTSYEGGRGLAVAGLAMGYAMTAVWLGILLLFLTARTML